MLDASAQHRRELDRARQLHAAGRLGEAVATYERVIAADPHNADALHLMGVAHLQVGRNKEALGLIERALSAHPAFPEAHNNRGNALKALGRSAEAADAYRAAIAANPRYAAAHHHLGIALFEARKFEAAEASYREALRLKPDYPDALSNLGTALRELGRLDEAVVCYEQALALQPDRAETLGGLGLALNRLDRVDAALASYDKALAHNPEHLDSHLSRSLLLLSLGRFAEGWPAFEQRLRMKEFAVAPAGAPRWQGESLAGKTLLCLAEQGLGDMIQFVRFALAPSVQAGRVVVAAPRRLVPLLRSVAGIEVVASAAECTADYEIPLMSLPGALGIGVDDLPVATAYLAADPGRVATWRGRLPSAGLRVGIAWQGNPNADVDRRRSVPLAQFAPIFDVPGAAFVSLQAGHGVEQIATVPFGSRIAQFGPDLDADGAFVDTAAIMAGLDLVITSDTATAHLAGALGVPTFVLLQQVPDWRWLRDREDTPFYPSVRLFRQSVRGDWSGPARRAAEALAALIGENAQ